MSETLLGQAALKLDAVRESAESQDSEKFYQALEALFAHLLAWIGKLVPHKLPSSGMVNITLTIFVAVTQVVQHANDQRDTQHYQAEQERRERVMEEKLGTTHSALEELKRNQKADVGKPYQIERTTAVFSRPGPKRQLGRVRVQGAVGARRRDHRAVDFHRVRRPVNLELRAGWIRKKYARLEE